MLIPLQFFETSHISSSVGYLFAVFSLAIHFSYPCASYPSVLYINVTSAEKSEITLSKEVSPFEPLSQPVITVIALTQFVSLGCVYVSVCVYLALPECKPSHGSNCTLFITKSPVSNMVPITQ